MKIYLAAPWADKAKMFHIADLFDNAGHTITWRWWEDGLQILKPSNKAESLRRDAYFDRQGVKEADTLIVFDTVLSEGKAFEQGLASAWDIPILGVGTLDPDDVHNVFHFLAKGYKWVPSVEDAIIYLGKAEEVWTHYGCKPGKR